VNLIHSNIKYACTYTKSGYMPKKLLNVRNDVAYILNKINYVYNLKELKILINNPRKILKM